MMPDGMLRFDATDTGLTATALLILNPQPMPHEVRSATVERECSIDDLRTQLSPHTDAMRSLLHIRVVNNGRAQSLLIDASAENAAEKYNDYATSLVGWRFQVYGRAILLPYLVSLTMARSTAD